MTDRSPDAGRPSAKPDDNPDDRRAAAGGWTSHIDWQRLVAGLVLVGVSTWLLVTELTAPEGTGMGLLSGPMGMALDMGGIVAGIWVLWTSWRR